MQFLFSKQFSSINYERLFESPLQTFQVRPSDQFLMSKKSISWLLDSKSDEIYSNEKFQVATFEKYSSLLKSIYVEVCIFRRTTATRWRASARRHARSCWRSALTSSTAYTIRRSSSSSVLFCIPSTSSTSSKRSKHPGDLHPHTHFVTPVSYNLGYLNASSFICLQGFAD